jgi:hypothetical protein
MEKAAMPQSADKSEFWRPVLDERRPVTGPTLVVSGAGEACARCATEFVMGSRFCHACGELRPASSAAPAPEVARSRQTLGSVTALVVGTLCLMAAVGTGLLFSVETVLDWEAVQSWRVQWLLAAIASFAAGILLKPAHPAR